MLSNALFPVNTRNLHCHPKFTPAKFRLDLDRISLNKLTPKVFENHALLGIESASHL